MADNSFSESDDENDDLNITIDSTTFGIPQHLQPSITITSSVGTANTNFHSAKESFDSLDSTNNNNSAVSLFASDVLSLFSPSSAGEEIIMPKTVAKGTMPAEEEPHFDAATQ